MGDLGEMAREAVRSWLADPTHAAVLVGGVFVFLLAHWATGGLSSRLLVWLVRWELGVRPPTGPYSPTWTRSTPKSEELLRVAREQPSANVPRSTYARMAGYQVMLVRGLVQGVVALAIWAPEVATTGLAWLMAAAGVSGVVWLTWWLLTRAYRRHCEDMVATWVDAVKRPLGWSDEATRRDFVTLPKLTWRWSKPLVAPSWAPDWVTRVAWALRVPVPVVPDMSDPDTEIVLSYPPAHAPDTVTRNRVTSILQERLRPGEWRVTWRDAHQQVVASHPARMPGKTKWTPDMFDGLGVLDVPVGVAAGGRLASYELPMAPHMVIQARTRWGKTVYLSLRHAHHLSRGARVMFLDPKVIGFIDLKDVPGVALATTEEAQVACMRTFWAEMRWRYNLIGQYPEIRKDVLAYFTPWFLVADERGSLKSNFEAWWRNQSEDGKPKGEAPVFDWERQILQMSAAAGMYVTTGAQQANLDVFKDSDRRDQHQARIAAGPQSGSMLRMLFPEHKKIAVPAIKGRALFSLGGEEEPKEIQLPWIEEEDLCELALTGVEIREKEEAERSRRIYELTGKTFIELSRPEPDLPGAGETWLGVPGGVPGQPAAEEKPQVKRLPTPRKPLELLPVSHLEPYRPPTERVPAGQEDYSAPEWVVTVAEAAKVAGYGDKVDSFRRARGRYKERTGHDIPGLRETPDGRFAIRRVDLLEWRSQQKAPLRKRSRRSDARKSEKTVTR